MRQNQKELNTQVRRSLFTKAEDGQGNTNAIDTMGPLCRAQMWGEDYLIEFIDLFEDLSHEPGTRQLQCNPKRSY